MTHTTPGQILSDAARHLDTALAAQGWYTDADYRRTTDFRDLIDGYHELSTPKHRRVPGTGGAMSVKFIADELGIHRADLVALVAEIEKIPGWAITRNGPHSGDIWIDRM